MVDLAIIGAGPAALSAALYAARLGLTVTVLEKAAVGGLLAQISDLQNYPGYQGSGAALAECMRQQAASYAGVSFRYGECTGLALDGPAGEQAPEQNTGRPAGQLLERPLEQPVGQAPERPTFRLTLDQSETLASRAVLIASGASPRPLDFALTAPVSYCALCDGALARGQRVAVVGGANAAVQESIFLSPLVASLDLFTHSRLKADPVLQAELRQLPNVQIHEQVEPTPELLNQYAYVFVFIGHQPATGFLRSLPQYPELVDQQGWVLTGAQARDDIDLQASTEHREHETAIPGLFAAGDVRAGMVRQVVTAAGDGASAAIEIAAYLAQK